MSGGGYDQMKQGERLVLAGLWVQIVAFLFFVAIAIRFDVIMRARSQRSDGNAKEAAAVRGGIVQRYRALPRWRKMLYALYASSALILVRNLFRVIEYAMGNAGYLMSHEVFLYVFDSVLMLALMLLLNAAHPGWLLPVGEVLGDEATEAGEDVEMGERGKE